MTHFFHIDCIIVPIRISYKMKISQKQLTPVAYKFGLGHCIHHVLSHWHNSSHKSCDKEAGKFLKNITCKSAISCIFNGVSAQNLRICSTNPVLPRFTYIMKIGIILLQIFFFGSGKMDHPLHSEFHAMLSWK